MVGSRRFPGEGIGFLGFPGGSNGKKSACNVGDLDLSPGLGRSPGEGNGYPLQYSGLENSLDRGAWWVTVNGFQRVGHDCVTFTHTYGRPSFLAR